MAFRMGGIILGLMLASIGLGQVGGYSKIEFMIPMRDGVRLYTQVYVPTDATRDAPILLERTPYGAGPVGRNVMRKAFAGSPKFVERGYIFAYQDVRGKKASEGIFVNVRPQLKAGQSGIDESTDAYDTIDFLVQNIPNNNGNVGLWGISYPGFYAAAGAINGHPALKAVSPQAPVSDWFIGDDVHHNGALFLQDIFDFWTAFNLPKGVTLNIDRADQSAYHFFLATGALPNYDLKHFKGQVPYWTNELMVHETMSSYWKDRSLPPQLKGITAAMLTIGGWFDAEDLWGSLNSYGAIHRQNPRARTFLVMGPWWHGMWAQGKGNTMHDLDFESNTSEYFREEIEFPFFERFLRGQRSFSEPPGATVFETGRNRWATFAAWPPAGLSQKRVYLDAEKTLSFSPPKASSQSHYVNDPAAPTPYRPDYQTNRRRTIEYMVEDQRSFSKRDDLATYLSPVLDSQLRVAGPIQVDLWVKTTGSDADFIVKIIDVWPADSKVTSPRRVWMANYQQILRAEVMRGKFRNSFEKPEPFLPGIPTRVQFELPDVFHTFRKGHRMMVHVQSSWFPLVDRNPNVFTNIRAATDDMFRPATISIMQGGEYASSIEFGEYSP